MYVLMQMYKMGRKSRTKENDVELILIKFENCNRFFMSETLDFSQNLSFNGSASDYFIAMAKIELTINKIYYRLIIEIFDYDLQK